MAYEILLFPAMIVAGSELRTSYENYACFSEIPAFWQEQMSCNLSEKLSNKTYPDVVLGLYTNYSKDFSPTSGKFSLIIGFPINGTDNVPAGMTVKHIPAGKYAVFTARGPFATACSAAWEEVWQTKDLDRTFTSDFEWYDKNSTNDANSVVKLYIAIK